MATFSRHQASIGNVGSYQVSGYPYISGSSITTAESAAAGQTSAHSSSGEVFRKGAPQHRYAFPKVAKSVTVIFTSGTAGVTDADATVSAGLRVHFNSTGSAGGKVISENHFIELNAVDESITFNTKCTEIYVSRADCSDGGGGASTIEYKVIAELTNIPTGEMNPLTGSGLTE